MNYEVTLMYHDIGEKDSKWCVSVENFRQQMESVKNTLITFDDGWKGVFINAYPIMRERDLKGRLYVVPSFVGKEGYMDWEEIKELVNYGFEVGSHTYSHKNLLNLSDEEIKFEIEEASKVIKEKLGIDVKHFAYPYGKYDNRVKEIVGKYFSSVMTTERGFAKGARQWVLKDTSLEEFKKLLVRPRISLCMITKNEEEFLGKCLESAKEVLDEIIVVDTGSTDKTKEIAKSFGARVYDFEWRDDFSLARNESLKYSSGDWILVLDADEELDSVGCKTILEAVNEWNVKGFNVVTKNYSEDSSTQGWVPGKPSGWYPSIKVRLFQKGFLFEGKMHEQVRVNNAKMLPAYVHHYGYLRGNKEEKLQNYVKLTRKKIKDNPQDARAYYELGIQQKELSKFSEAENSLLLSLGLKRGYLAQFNLAVVQQKQGKTEEAVGSYEKAITLRNNAADAFFGLGFCYYSLGKMDLAKGAYLNALKHNPRFVDAYINLAALSNEDEALSYLKKALTLSPRNGRGWYNLGVVHEKNDRVEAAIECYERAAKFGYSNLQEKIIKMKEFMQKIQSE